MGKDEENLEDYKHYEKKTAYRILKVREDNQNSYQNGKAEKNRL